MLLTAVLLAGLGYCLWQMWRGSWWASGALFGAALPSLITFASIWQGNPPIQIALLALTAGLVFVALPSLVRR